MYGIEINQGATNSISCVFLNESHAVFLCRIKKINWIRDEKKIITCDNYKIKK